MWHHSFQILDEHYILHDHTARKGEVEDAPIITRLNKHPDEAREISRNGPSGFR